MPPSEDAIQYLTGPDAPAQLRWINTDRKSHDWKVKIFQHDKSGLQLAIYDRKKIFVLFEHDVDGVAGTKRLPKRPKSDALTVGTSKFGSLTGSCYEVDDLASLGKLVAKYFELESMPVPEVSTLCLEFDIELLKSLADSVEARRSRLATASKKPRKIKATTTVFVRNPDVVAEVLLRANGICEGCGSPAPFKRRSTGSPFLEVHHRTPLVEGGDDTVENAIALCPNCHRQCHYG
jgi:hypothetical protein